MRNIIYIPDSTWTDLDQEPIFQKFMKEYIELLQNNLTKIKVKGDSYSTSLYTHAARPTINGILLETLQGIIDDLQEI